jgi:hypothetical protein
MIPYTPTWGTKNMDWCEDLWTRLNEMRPWRVLTWTSLK